MEIYLNFAFSGFCSVREWGEVESNDGNWAGAWFTRDGGEGEFL